MNKIIHKSAYFSAFTALIMAASLSWSALAQAQTASSMPVLYNSSGNTVNTSGGTLSAGTYYLGGTPSQGGHQVQYLGNGTYYDPTTLTYGGSVSDPNGTAGVSFGYTVPSTSPGIPNTGAGGNASTTWFVLIASAVVALGGMAYISRQALA